MKKKGNLKEHEWSRYYSENNKVKGKKLWRQQKKQQKQVQQGDFLKEKKAKKGTRKKCK